MEAKEIIYDIREALKPVKEQNKTVISVEALENYLSILEKDAALSNCKLDRDQNHSLITFQAENQRWIKEYEVENSNAIEMFRSVIMTGQSALKASMIINGGAAIALLAFIGNMLKNPPVESIQDLLAVPMWLFCLGVLLSATASGTTYLSQFAYSNNWMKFGGILHVITVIVVLSSYALFGVGSYSTMGVFVPTQ